MPVAGETYVPQLQVPGGDATTVARLFALTPADMVVALDVHPDPDETSWAGDPIVLTGGEYRLFWTVTGVGAFSVMQIVTVGPDPQQVPAGFSFATTGDLVTYSGKPLPGDARRLLIDASREIERITKTAVYPLAPGGLPAEERVRRALADATCELVGWWDETGTGTGARALFTSASIAGVSLGFGGQSAGNPQADRVGPRVWSILMNAGLLAPGGVQYG